MLISAHLDLLGLLPRALAALAAGSAVPDPIARQLLPAPAAQDLLLQDQPSTGNTTVRLGS